MSSARTRATIKAGESAERAAAGEERWWLLLTPPLPSQYPPYLSAAQTASATTRSQNTISASQTGADVTDATSAAATPAPPLRLPPSRRTAPGPPSSSGTLEPRKVRTSISPQYGPSPFLCQLITAIHRRTASHPRSPLPHYILQGRRILSPSPPTSFGTSTPSITPPSSPIYHSVVHHALTEAQKPRRGDNASAEAAYRKTRGEA